MLKAIKTNLFLNEQQRKVQQAKVDKSHDFIPERYLKGLLKMLHNKKSKNQLLNILYKKMHAKQLTLRIKSLVVFHACIRQKMDSEFIEVILNEQIQIESPTKKKDKVTIEFNNYIKQNVINFYIAYIQKIVMFRESYQLVKNVCQSRIFEFKKMSRLQLISHGFKIINISTYLITSQQMFNKMGRYHNDYNQILNLFVQLLHDLTYFNNFIKTTVEYLIKDNSYNEFKRVQRSLETISVNGQGISEGEPSENQIQQTKHIFLYIHEAQKLSDKFYEYFHNRYYYRTLRRLIIFPSFLQISPKQYSMLRNKAKRVDKNLVIMVKISKYQGHQRYHTQNPMNHTSLNFRSEYKLKTFDESSLNTDITNNQSSKQYISKAYENATIDFIQPLNKKSSKYEHDEFIKQEEVEDF